MMNHTNEPIEPDYVPPPEPEEIPEPEEEEVRLPPREKQPPVKGRHTGEDCDRSIA